MLCPVNHSNTSVYLMQNNKDNIPQNSPRGGMPSSSIPSGIGAATNDEILRSEEDIRNALLGSRRMRPADGSGNATVTMPDNKRSRLSVNQHPNPHGSIQEDHKANSDESKRGPEGNGRPAPSLVDLMVNMDGAVQQQRQQMMLRQGPSSAGMSGGAQMSFYPLGMAKREETSQDNLAGSNSSIPGATYTGMNLPMGGGGGGGNASASGGAGLYNNASLPLPNMSAFSMPQQLQQVIEGNSNLNPNMLFQSGSQGTGAYGMPFAQAATAPPQEKQLQQQQQQQYLQEYLNGLQQANAAGSSRQTMVSPQANFPNSLVGRANNLGSGTSNMPFPFNPSMHHHGGSSNAMAAQPLMTSSFQQYASSPQGFSLGGFPSSGGDSLLGGMRNVPLPGQSANMMFGALMGGSATGFAGNPSPASLMVPGGDARLAADGFPMTLPQLLAQHDDSPNLTNHQILLRHQIEVFEAGEDDTSTHTRGRNKPVMLGQVGVRCKHCKHIPVLQRQKGSTYFPNSLLGLYQAAQNMNTVHMQCGLCTKMPEEVKRQFVHSMCYSKVHQSGAGRHYWARSAKKLGLVDTEHHGIRFIRNMPPGSSVVDTSS